MKRILAALLLLCLLPGAALARGVPTVTPAVRHYLPALWVTGYDLPGTTASGLPVRPGICATDWIHIPKFAHVHIPGVGACYVTDTGVQGWAVDVWFRTAAECYAVTGRYIGAYWTR